MNINHASTSKLSFNREFYTIYVKQDGTLDLKIRTLNIFQRALRFLFGAYSNTIWNQSKSTVLKSQYPAEWKKIENSIVSDFVFTRVFKISKTDSEDSDCDLDSDDGDNDLEIDEPINPTNLGSRIIPDERPVPATMSTWKKFARDELQEELNGIDLSFLERLFRINCVPLPKKSINYNSDSDDFGVEIKRLMFAKPDDNHPNALERFLRTGLKLDHIPKNIVFYGKKFGFEVVFSNYQYCLRDNLIRMPDGVYNINASENVSIAIARNESRALVSHDKPHYLTDHLYLKSTLGVALAHVGKASKDLVDLFKASKDFLPNLRFYIEGGNHYVMTSSSGKKVVLLGEDIFYISLNQMRQDGVFKDLRRSMESDIEEYMNMLSLNPSLLMDTLQEMYSQGLLSVDKEKNKFITREEISYIDAAFLRMERKKDICSFPFNSNLYLDSAIKMGYYIPLEFPDSKKGEGLRVSAKYLAQKKLTKKIIAESFSVNPEQVVIVPQLDYHLDVFLRPGPNGSIFLQDYSLCVKLLNDISGQSEKLGLTYLDNTILKRYCTSAEKLARDLGPLYEDIKKKLETAGLYVIPAPGIFYDLSPDHLIDDNPAWLDSEDIDRVKTYNVNFLNAITGWSSKTHSYFYLTTGASVGRQLGKVLMNSFEVFMKFYQPDIEMGFLGFDPNNNSDFSEGMTWLNRRGAQLGPHCLSFLMETVSHQDKLHDELHQGN